MSLAHKGEILSLNKQIIPISKNTIFHANYEFDLNGFNQGQEISPFGYQKALSFNASTNYIDLGVNNALRSTTLTIEAWVKINSLPSDANLGYVIYSNYASLRGCFVSIKNTGKAHIRVHDGTNAFSLDGTTVLSTNTWYHICGVIDYSAKKIYIHVNGVQEGSLTFTDYLLADNINGSHIGGWYTGGSLNYAFNGIISDVRAWNYVRTQTQTKDNMNIESRGDEVGLVGCWKLNEGSDSIVYDSSINGNDGVIKGFVTWSEGRTVATLRPSEGKFNGAIAIESPTTNLYPGPSLPGYYFTSAYNSGQYNFGPNTNIQWDIDNSDQFIPGFDVQKISLINGATQTMYLEWTQLYSRGGGTTFAANEERTISFYYYGTFGTRLTMYMNSVVGNVVFYADNAVSGNGTSSITVPVKEKGWQRVIFRMKNNDATTSTVPNTWMILHANQQTATLSNTEYWKFTGFQVEKKSFATSFIYGSRSVGRLWYPKELLNLSKFTVSCWINIPHLPTAQNPETQGIQGSWWNPIIEVASPVGSTTTNNLSLLVAPNASGFNKALRIYAAGAGATGTTPLSENTWYHYTATYDGTTYKMYLNGALELTYVGAPVPVNSDAVLMVGGGYMGMPGIIMEDLRIDNDTTPADEIMSWYQSDSPFYNYLDYSNGLV